MVQSGDKFGNYEVSATASGAADVLGSGSGGTTVRVRHVHLETIAALKILRRRAHADSRQGKNFLTEAKSAASLNHPNIARILDFGENAGLLYYVMDLCEGGSLEDYRNKKGAPEITVALTWLHQAAAALAHAHEKNILHRDIKPSNLLLARENGQAALKLIDFGLAGKTDGESGDAEPVIGTPLFAAPEQLRGQAEKASDVFSMGAAFLWLLTGKYLDTGDLTQVIDRRLAATSYAVLLNELTPAWREVLGSMLDVNPATRPANGEAVVKLVEGVFTSSLPLPSVAWSVVSEERQQSPTAVATPEKAWTAVEADWNGFWTPVNEIAVDGCRLLCSAKQAGDDRVWDIQVFESPEAVIEDALVPQGPILQRHAGALGLEVVALHKGNGWWSVAWPSLQGKDALDWLRVDGVPTAGALLPRIRVLAGGLDSAHRDGLGAMELHPALLHLLHGNEPVPMHGFAVAVYLPSMAGERNTRETASTLSGSLNAPLPIRFAACLYHLLGGRPVPPAAFINNRAYPAVPKLSERSNRYLGQVISGINGTASCTEIVDRLSLEERLPGVSGNISETLTRSMVAPSASSSVSRSSMPPATQAVVSPGAFVPTPPAPPSTAGKPQSGQAAAESGMRKVLIAAACFVVLGMLAGAGYAGLSYFRSKNTRVTAEHPSNLQAREHHSARTVESNVIGTPTLNTPPLAASSILVLVPSQASTLTEAVARCQSGGEIEIDGGTYAEAVTITKSLTMRGKNGAVIESSAGGSSVISVKGKAEVKLTGLIVKDPGREASGNPEQMPPLVLVSDGSSLKLDQCAIDGGKGSGISLINNSSAQVTGCRVVRNRWCGVQVASGSKLNLDQASVLENRTGVLAVHPGTQVEITNGSVVSRNSRNGVEIAAGAVVKLTGAEISSSQSDCGVTVVGEGAVLSGKRSLICDNKKNGIYVKNGGAADLQDSQFERNQENGVRIDQSGKVKFADCRFENVMMGVFADGASTVTEVSQCDFVKHGDFGVVIVGGKGVLNGCNFTNNAQAVMFSEQASGSVTSNKVQPGPADKLVELDNAGEVDVRDNSVTQ